MAHGNSGWLKGAMLGLGLALTTVAVPAEAHMGARGLGWLRAELELSDDQVQAIRQLHQGQRDARRALYRSLREARAALRELVLQGGDDAAIQAKAAEIQQLLGRAVERRVETLKGLAQILTPEQREKLAKLRPRHFMGKPGPGGGAPAARGEGLLGA